MLTTGRLMRPSSIYSFFPSFVDCVDVWNVGRFRKHWESGRRPSYGHRLLLEIFAATDVVTRRQTMTKKAHSMWGVS